MQSPDPLIAWLAEVRRSEQISQLTLANEVGVGQSAISAIESGARRPTLERTRAIAEALGYRLTLAPMAGEET
ncbi:helix-turn-helix domain-containing protein [Spongiactinospora gelatinilytica]|uniref:helix-turn-helix domain-containing protein n=1 Tax=Spongiactinospora gelatinilytica TaxID=2666298 RepID=UPI0018F7AB9B|nr:helix-turn-helix transcriptional regulator [Spongiactinospora gelatinilytica]